MFDTSAEINMKHVGFVALIGRPNAWKSTFLNTLLEEKVSGVSSKPQTTQKMIRGIYNDNTAQIIFYDTPGLHESTGLMNQVINNHAIKYLKQAQVIVRFIDISRTWGDEEENISKILSCVDHIPCILVYSKCDLPHAYTPSDLSVNIFLSSISTSTSNPVSSSLAWNFCNKQGFSDLLAQIKKYLPKEIPVYPEDYYTDQDIHTRISEIIREKMFQNLEEELPYASFIDISEILEEENIVKIYANIYVESESQKKICIWRWGEKIKKIWVQARFDLEHIFDKKIFLGLRVKIRQKWRKDEKFLQNLFQ